MGQRLHGLEQVVLRLGLRRLSPALTLVVGGAGRPGEAVPAGLALIPLLRVQTKVARVEAQPHGGVGAPVVSPYLRTSSGRRPPAGPPRAPGGSEAQPHAGDVSRCPKARRCQGFRVSLCLRTLARRRSTWGFTTCPGGSEAQPHAGDVGGHARRVLLCLRTLARRRPTWGFTTCPGGSEAQPHVGDVGTSLIGCPAAGSTPAQQGPGTRRSRPRRGRRRRAPESPSEAFQGPLVAGPLLSHRGRPRAPGRQRHCAPAERTRRGRSDVMLATVSRRRNQR